MSQEKLSKQLIRYIYNPNTEYRCEECGFLGKDKKCTFITPKEADVKSTGSCMEFREGKNGAFLGPGNLTRHEVGYVDTPFGTGCRRCEYFNADYRKCKKVNEEGGPTPGKIHPRACCDKWDGDKVREKISNEGFKIFGQKYN